MLNIELGVIVAMDNNRCIGKDNALPWSLKPDLAHFKRTTQETDSRSSIKGVLIMGRKTFESMGSKPLPNRMSIIITGQKDYMKKNGIKRSHLTFVVPTYKHAFTLACVIADTHGLKKVWAIGGVRVFQNAMKHATTINVTEIDTEVEDGDTFFPELPDDVTMTYLSRKQHDPVSDLGYRFKTYTRSTF